MFHAVTNRVIATQYKINCLSGFHTWTL